MDVLECGGDRKRTVILVSDAGLWKYDPRTSYKPCPSLPGGEKQQERADRIIENGRIWLVEGGLEGHILGNIMPSTVEMRIEGSVLGLSSTTGHDHSAILAIESKHQGGTGPGAEVRKCAVAVWRSDETGNVVFDAATSDSLKKELSFGAAFSTDEEYGMPTFALARMNRDASGTAAIIVGCNKAWRMQGYIGGAWSVRLRPTVSVSQLQCGFSGRGRLTGLYDVMRGGGVAIDAWPARDGTGGWRFGVGYVGPVSRGTILLYDEDNSSPLACVAMEREGELKIDPPTGK
jgi:hypothetical protein